MIATFWRFHQTQALILTHTEISVFSRRYSFCFRFFQINVKIYIFWFDEFVEKMNLRFSDFSLLHSIRISSNFRFSLLLKVIFIFYFITKQLNKRVPLQSYEPMVIKVVEQVLPNSKLWKVIPHITLSLYWTSNAQHDHCPIVMCLTPPHRSYVVDLR